MLFRQLNLLVKQFNFLCPVFGSNSLLFRSDSTPPYNFVCHLSLRDGNLSSEPKFKSSLFLRSTCNLRRVMIKYKARARKEDPSVSLPPYPRRFKSAPYFHLSCNCAQISQRLPLHSSNSVAISNRGVILLYSLQIYEDSIKLQVSTAK